MANEAAIFSAGFSPGGHSIPCCCKREDDWLGGRNRTNLENDGVLLNAGLEMRHEVLRHRFVLVVFLTGLDEIGAHLRLLDVPARIQLEPQLADAAV